ncbi:hypothetical protein VFPPC_08617 [Pochonia chlamydosporia 170]|uniref:Uncharacterized protein n=1 Tax=Pochonia chlamydosporia 170 TaxID=1380566 RepID=A0A179FNK3_METCM|nr:hypothetical protein VFPPC_08617 [Pochonia chlamydosporia 170]OAQ67172.1 hypothetical protein VFPPC_08617 [Pochonia chlamydosporia 170]
MAKTHFRGSLYSAVCQEVYGSRRELEKDGHGCPKEPCLQDPSQHGLAHRYSVKPCVNSETSDLPITCATESKITHNRTYRGPGRPTLTDMMEYTTNATVTVPPFKKRRSA